MTPANRSWFPLRFGENIESFGALDSAPGVTHQLGLLLQIWSIAEESLSYSLSILLEGQRQAADAVFFTLNSTDTRISVVRSVAKAVLPKGLEQTDFLYLLDKLRDLAKDRNEFVHGSYLGDGTQMSVAIFRPVNAIPYKEAPVSAKILAAHITKVQRLIGAMMLANTDEPERWARSFSLKQRP